MVSAAASWVKTWVWFIFLLVLFAPAAGAQTQELALTFDDLPAHGPLPPGVSRQQVAAQIIAALQHAGAPPITGFVNGSLIKAQPDLVQVLEMWRKAGFPLGNHTWSHMDLDTHTAQQFEQEILLDEPVLQQEMGDLDWHWFRYPYLREGKDPAKRKEIRAFLLTHHYRVAGVTAYFGDVDWNAPYARCLARGDTAAVQWLETTYLDAAAKDLARREVMAKSAYGHGIPLVGLMHIGAFDAHMLPKLLAYYQSQGVRLVTLQEAEMADFYRVDTNLSVSGPHELEAVLKQKHRRIPKNIFPPARLGTLCQ